MSEEKNKEQQQETKNVKHMYETWFLDYASYVILERAVPAVEDGLKPVQRRILHAMKEMDDGRFNKVANIIGQTMQYHPHGDASIGDAMVGLGQKDLMIETQGNWGDVRTGDDAAAPRYIEARLSKFAHEVAFNAKTTTWQLSYDGRKQEPLTLPMKFPLLLAQGVEGIAVGLATKVLPHNFCELLKASIDAVRGKKVTLYPDFPTGGLIDVTNYDEGKRGGKVRVRARIEELDKKTLVIRDIPFSVTTTQLMESIVKANDSGKIKIKKVIDNTAKDVEIQIQLAPGISPDITIDALYKFTNCEISISPNTCVILNDKPHFLSVNELLRISTENTMDLLKRELEIKLAELQEDWHFSSLEKIFIEKRIYRDIEECETWEAVIKAIDKGLSRYKKLFKREITEEDIVRLTEIKIKRISKFDSFKADEHIKGVEDEISKTKYHIEHLKEFAIDYFENLLNKYGNGRERKTEIKIFDTIEAKHVAIANQKLYVNYSEGFIGTDLKKDEFAFDCSDYDEIIAFRRDGKMMITKVTPKAFVGKDIIHLEIFNKNDDRTVYHLIYQDGKAGHAMVKRFKVGGVTRDKEYDLTKGTPGSKVVYFSKCSNAENEIVAVTLHPNSKAHKKVFDYDFKELAVKGRSSQGNILARYVVSKVKLIKKDEPIHTGIKLWYDSQFGKMNTEEKGQYIGHFEENDSVLSIYNDGNYETTGTELTNKYDADKLLVIEKFNPDSIITALYFEASNQTYYLKRFKVETQTNDKKFLFIPEGENNKVILATTNPHPKLLLKKGKKRAPTENKIDVNSFIEVKGWKALGNKLAENDFISAEWIGIKKQHDAIKESSPELFIPAKPVAKTETKTVPTGNNPSGKAVQNAKTSSKNNEKPSTSKSIKNNLKDVVELSPSGDKIEMEWDVISPAKTSDKDTTKNDKQTSLF